MQNFTTAAELGFISKFDYFWTEQDLFKCDGLHLNRMGTNHNLTNFTVFSLNWHFPQRDPAQCPNLASHNPVLGSAGQAGPGSVSSIDSLTHVESSVSPGAGGSCDGSDGFIKSPVPIRIPVKIIER